MNGVVDLTTDEITYLRDENTFLRATVERLRQELAESENARLLAMRSLDRDRGPVEDQGRDPNKEDKGKRRPTRVTYLD